MDLDLYCKIDNLFKIIYIYFADGKGHLKLSLVIKNLNVLYHLLKKTYLIGSKRSFKQTKINIVYTHLRTLLLFLESNNSSLGLTIYLNIYIYIYIYIYIVRERKKEREDLSYERKVSYESERIKSKLYNQPWRVKIQCHVTT